MYVHLVPQTEWQDSGPIEVERTVIVVDGEAYQASTPLPTEESARLGILSKRYCQVADQGIEQRVKHEVSMWSGVQGHAPKFPSGGCWTFLLALFKNVVILSRAAETVGLASSIAADDVHEANADRELLDLQIAEHEPWLVVNSRSCITRNLWRQAHVACFINTQAHRDGKPRAR